MNNYLKILVGIIYAKTYVFVGLNHPCLIQTIKFIYSKYKQG